jgi:hypothetical protein
LSHRQNARLDQREAGIRHLKCLFLSSVLDVEKCLVLLAFPCDALLVLPAFNASNAVRFQSEAQFFVPVFLLCGKENERLFAIATSQLLMSVMHLVSDSMEKYSQRN